MDPWQLIGDYLPLEIRSPRGGGGKGGHGHSSSSSSKGGKGSSGSDSSSSSGSSSGGSSKSGSSSSSSSSGGTTVVIVGGGTSYNHYHGSGYIGNLPTWSVLLIIWASLILTIFLCALLYYILKERERAKNEGQRPRIKHALWKAAKVAFFIWLAIKIWNCCCGRARRKSRGANKAGTYAKIDQDGQQGGDTWYGAQTAPAVADPAATAYGLGGKGSPPAESKYEPMGYSGASGITPSPLNSSSPAAAPPKFGALASPPPYSGTAPTSITAGTATASQYATIATSSGGEAQGYYASMGMSGAYVPSVSSTYEPSVLSSSAPTPVPAYHAAYHPPPVSPEPPSAQIAHPPPTSPPPAQYPVYQAQATYVPYTSPGPRYGGY